MSIMRKFRGATHTRNGISHCAYYLEGARRNE